jgi:hypothetical protein
VKVRRPDAVSGPPVAVNERRHQIVVGVEGKLQVLERL